MLDPSGLWTPLLSAKQRLLYDSQKRYILVSGPRRSTKTVGVAKRMIRHAWETPAAKIAVVCRTQRSGKDGPWPLLCDPQRGLVNEWIEAGVSSDDGAFGYEPGKPPGSRLDATTRQPGFAIVNQFGGLSEFKLFSLDVESQVEEKFLGTNWSAVWVSELQNFKEPGIFTVAKEQLRMQHLPYESHMWISDTNPPEEGDMHWAYDYWFRQRVSECAPDVFKGEEQISWFRQFQSDLELFQFDIADNTFEDPRALASLKASYAGDPEGWDRFILGKWTRGTGLSEKWFARDFRKNGADPHVLGECLGTDEANWSVILPVDGCKTLYAGFDVGHVNHAFTILQKRNGPNGIEWDILDEVVSIGEEILLEDFGYECLERMKAIEEAMGIVPQWVVWGDLSMERFRPGTPEGNDAAVIEAACENKFQIQFSTGEGGSQRPRSLNRRLVLFKSLLQQNRIKISANCFKTIEMCEGLRRGTRPGQATKKEDQHKHPFDSCSYCIYPEMLLAGERMEQVSKVSVLDYAVTAPW